MSYADTIVYELSGQLDTQRAALVAYRQWLVEQRDKSIRLFDGGEWLWQQVLAEFDRTVGPLLKETP